MPTILDVLEDKDHDIRLETWSNGSMVLRTKGHTHTFDKQTDMTKWVKTLARLFSLIRDDDLEDT
jgi:hypothetical protein